MPMASTFVFKFIGVFLAFYISVASAVPTDGRSINPNDTLRPRKTPDQNLCRSLLWIYRECRPSVGVGSWNDHCLGYDNGNPFTYEGFSTCPPRNVCEDIVDEDGDRTIKC